MGTGTSRALRGAVVTTSVAAIGAAMLAGTTGSTSGGAQAAPVVASVTQIDGENVHAVAHAVPASAPSLYGFAPPAESTAATNAQFRVAANLPSGPLGIPGVVLQAYKLAATRVASESPQCKLPWFLLAGIGRIESGHAGNGNVDELGNSRTKIRGPVLDGSLAGNEVITDTDGGAFDGDARHDRAMGPMQFIPSTWKAWGSDANGDGKADPDNIFDATYSAGRYLCHGVSDILADGSKVNNVLRYNRSVAYANNVLGWAAAYATGVIPTEGIPEMNHAAPTDKKDKKDKKDEKPGESTDESTTSTTKPKPAQPQQHCLGAICLPPGLGPQAAPKSTPKKAPKSSGTQQATPKAPATQKPATQKPATQKPATQKPATQKPAAKKPAAAASTPDGR